MEFTDSEARNARDICEKLFGADVIDRDEYRGFLVPEDFNRLSLVFYFVQAARGSSDLGRKIAQYVTCFEALFCTDSSEMTHKLAERVAFFLGENGAERTSIFKNIKAAYTVRSKVVHGDKIDKKRANQAPDLSRTCDELLRKSLAKV
jgi:Apea-like HEPN